MKNHSLRSQIIWLCCGLIFITSGAILSVTWWSTEKYSRIQVEQDVTQGQEILKQYLRAKEQILLTAARVLTADFGFKQAIVSADKQTIVSVLENHAARIGSQIMLLTNLQGQLISASPAGITNDQELLATVSQLTRKQGSTDFVIFNRHLYQLLLLPVHTPRPSAYAIIGFQINQDVAMELSRLTNLGISFLGPSRQLLVSSLGQPSEILSQADMPEYSLLNHSNYVHRREELTADGHISVMLSSDQHLRQSQMSRLLLGIMLISGIIFVIAVTASILLARNLTVPLQQLLNMARKFAAGDYQHKQGPNGTEEIQTLSQAMIDMGNEVYARERQIRYQAEHDQLTGLLNRYSLRQYLQQALDNTPGTYLCFALNIREFKHVNDSFGPQTGDKCLLEIAARLRKMHEQGLYARIGGDEFIAILPLADDQLESLSLMQFSALMANSFDIDDLHLKLTYHCGISRFPEDGENAIQLIKRALIAMDLAHSEGLDLRMYVTGEDEAHMERLSLLEDLREALKVDDGQLRMVYQPKMNLKDGKIHKVESLIRWQRPNHGWVSPELFVSLAEQAGLIQQLTQWVISTVLKQLAEWQKQGVKIQAAINLSAQDINRPGFYSDLLAGIGHFDITPEHVTLELTERDLMTNEANTTLLLERLREIGFCISIDDYGVGQSSLSKLTMLPIEELKIDKSFVLQLDQNPNDQAIVSSTIQLAHKLGFSVVAEGVENQASLDLLRQMGCDSIQGYYLSKPIPGQDICSWLKNFNPHEKGMTVDD